MPQRPHCVSMLVASSWTTDRVEVNEATVAVQGRSSQAHRFCINMGSSNMKQLTTILTLVGVICFFNLTAQAAEDHQPLTFELLEKTTYSENPPPVFPAGLSKLEGQRVRISGFMVPYTDTGEFEQLVLVNTPGGCFSCSSLLPNAVVFVRRLASEPPLEYTADLVSFEGILHLWNSEMKDDDDAKGFFFTIDNAKVTTQGNFSKAIMWVKKMMNIK